MRAGIAAQLQRQTRADVAAWNARVRASGADADEEALRAWLRSQSVAGYPQMILVYERFGYPEFLLTPGDKLIDDQYADRSHLRLLYDRILALAHSCGPVTVQARKGYVSLVGPKRTFAVLKPTTRTRLDLGLRLAEGPAASPRLTSATGLGSEAINARLGIVAETDIDPEIERLLEQAYTQNA
ncbi:MAG: hypothetical protein JO247_08885 [Chloroflexi bacterium]|nr:hypothetical protein [Chloroflexota bacterium]